MDESGRWTVYCEQKRRPHIVFPGGLSGQEAVGGKSLNLRVQSRMELTCNQPVLLLFYTVGEAN